MKLNKKKLGVLIGSVFSFLLLIIIVIFSLSSCNKTDGYKFKKEYESYNRKEASNGYKYQKLKINKKNKIKYIDKSEIMDILKNETGLIYLGYPNCPWCRGIVPTLIDVTNKSDLQEIYYLDMTDIRDIYAVENDKVKEIQKGADEYYEMLSYLDEYLDDYIVTDEDNVEYEVSEKRIYVPLLIAVQDGIIKEVHSGSIELDENQTPYDELTNSQISELEVIINNLVDSLYVN